MIQIEKRSGMIVPFDKQRIISAINKAFIEVDGELYEDDTARDIADEIFRYAEHCANIISVEEVQNQVEEYLMRSERKDVARAYIRYRYKREIMPFSVTLFKSVPQFTERFFLDAGDIGAGDVQPLSQFSLR